ncbi:MAG: NepR family anti-sigma factor [Pseudomonadota bacterium]
MSAKDTARRIKDQMIEDNLKRAFTSKANEAVPDELLALLDKLKAQDDSNGPS